MRSHRRRGPVEHVLIAGDRCDLAAIQRILDTLSADAYGQVFVEGRGPRLIGPARVTISRLVAERSTPGSLQAGDPAPGTALEDAVLGWLAEWMPDEPTPDRDFTIWIGGHAGGRMNGLYARLDSHALRI